MKTSQHASRHAIRREMRQRRRALSPRQQKRAAQQLAKVLARQPLFQRSRHIAFYIASDGEIDPRYLMRIALQRGKRCYLPVLHPRRENVLWFLPYQQGTALTRNRFGIPEPQTGRSRRKAAPALDLVLLPLVAFDVRGGRLGMGAGFYDRTFAFKAGQTRQSPALLGLAHSCQEVDQLPVAAWDIPLKAVAHEAGVVDCGEGASQRDFLRQDLVSSKVLTRETLASETLRPETQPAPKSAD